MHEQFTERDGQEGAAVVGQQRDHRVDGRVEQRRMEPIAVCVGRDVVRRDDAAQRFCLADPHLLHSAERGAEGDPACGDAGVQLVAGHRPGASPTDDTELSVVRLARVRRHATARMLGPLLTVDGAGDDERGSVGIAADVHLHRGGFTLVGHREGGDDVEPVDASRRSPGGRLERCHRHLDEAGARQQCQPANAMIADERRRVGRDRTLVHEAVDGR